MRIKLHYLFCHLDNFPKNLEDMSKEQRERNYQDIKAMEKRYQGQWGTHLMADYCWCLMQDCSEKHCKQKSCKKTFLQMSSISSHYVLSYPGPPKGGRGDNNPAAHELERGPIQMTLRSKRPIEIACEELYIFWRSPTFGRKNR